MRKINIFSAVLSLFLLLPASITWAQTIITQKGLTTAVFNLPQGKIKIYLPDDIRAGDVISGRIVMEASGKNVKQIEKNQGELTKYSIRLSNEKFPVLKGKEVFQLLIQADRKLKDPIELLNVSGIKKAELMVPESKEQKPGASECVIPSHAVTGSPLRISGPFDGNSSNTNCTIENKPVTILAESSRQCIITYPPEAGGLHNLYIQENGKPSCSKQVSGVDMKVSAGKLNLRKGEKTYIDITITGLKDLPDTALLKLENVTGDIVKMAPSDMVSIPISPDSVGPGVFSRRFDIQSIQTGSFIVNVDLDLPEVYYEIKKLDKPRRLESESLHTGLSQAIKKLEADAGGAAGKEYNEVCDNCQKCIRALAGKWAEDLVRKLGEEMIKEFLGQALDMIAEGAELLSEIKELVDDAGEKLETADEIMKELEDEIRAGELQMLVFKDQLCDSNKDCVVSAIVFYNPETGCVVAIVKCNGRVPACCPNAFTTVKISYCTDEKGMPKDMPKVEVIKK